MGGRAGYDVVRSTAKETLSVVWAAQRQYRATSASALRNRRDESITSNRTSGSSTSKLQSTPPRAFATLYAVDRLPLDVIPIRNAPWSERNGLVVIEREQPQVKSLETLRRWIGWAWQPKVIKLDEQGSFVWCRLDGRTSMGEITRTFILELPDSPEEIERRIVDFLTTLAGLGLILVRRGE